MAKRIIQLLVTTAVDTEFRREDVRDEIQSDLEASWPEVTVSLVEPARP